MFRTFTAIAVAMLASPALAQDDKATAEAVEACQAVSETFTAIAECVPNMDPALSALSAFSDIYGPAAEPLKTKCLDINDDQISAFVCVRKAIEEAVDLGRILPADKGLDDPVFNAISSAHDLERLNEIHEAARAKFPPNSGRMSVMYQRYR